MLTDTKSRSQLTLFVSKSDAFELETIRSRVDPIQHGLIAAHVTLCREDEIAGITPDAIRRQIADSKARPITLQFGAAERFHGHGIQLPCVAGSTDFDTLRSKLLSTSSVRNQSAHVTLAHPRNPKSVGNCMSAIANLPPIISITFCSISLIEQTGFEAWRVIEEFDLPLD